MCYKNEIVLNCILYTQKVNKWEWKWFAVLVVLVTWAVFIGSHVFCFVI